MQCYLHIQLVDNTALHPEPAHMLSHGDSKVILHPGWHKVIWHGASWCSAVTAQSQTFTEMDCLMTSLRLILSSFFGNY